MITYLKHQNDKLAAFSVDELIPLFTIISLTYQAALKV